MKPNTIIDKEFPTDPTEWRWTGTEFICGCLNGFNQPESLLGINNNKECITMKMMLDDPGLGQEARKMFRARKPKKSLDE